MFLSTLPTSSSLLCLLCLLLLPNALAEKNWTQWSAITGTWTAQSNIDLGIGDMKLGIVMFMGPDSLGQQKQTCLGPGTCGDGEQYQDGGVCPGPCDTMNNNTICLQTTFPDGGHHEDQVKKKPEERSDDVKRSEGI